MRYAPIQTACPTRDPRSLTLSPRQTFLLIFSLRAHAWCQHADLSGVSMFAAANLTELCQFWRHLACYVQRARRGRNDFLHLVDMALVDTSRAIRTGRSEG